MEYLLALDQQFFFLINHLPHAVWSDFIAEAASGFGYAWIIWLAIGIMLFVRKEEKDHWFWVPLGVAGILCYGLSEVLVKNIVMRSRPDILISTIIVRVMPGSYSFPSTHATVAFACAYLFSRKEIHWLWMYGLAVLVCISRIYLGHHYPLDVVGGAILGTVIGMVSMKLDEHLHRANRIFIIRSAKKRRKRI